jgi:hypothetical protein
MTRHRAAPLRELLQRMVAVMLQFVPAAAMSAAPLP